MTQHNLMHAFNRMRLIEQKIASSDRTLTAYSFLGHFNFIQFVKSTAYFLLHVFFSSICVLGIQLFCKFSL